MSALDARHVLVTGAAGLLGRSVVTRLEAAGSYVTALTRRRYGYAREVVADLTISNAEALTQMIGGPPAVIIHLAAAVPNNTRPDNEANADITRMIDRVIRSCATSWHAHLIYASTCLLYERKDSAWKTEDASYNKRTPYLFAKAEGESAILADGGTVLRISSVYGREPPSGTILGIFVTRAARGETIEVWGSGSREQDFVAADDVADAMVSAAEKQVAGIFNIASGKPLCMRNLADLVAARAAGRVHVIIGRQDDPQEGETARFAISRAADRIGWYPRASLPEEIVRWTKMQNSDEGKS